MNRLERTAIFLVSVLSTFVGFAFMAAPVVDILRIGRLAGQEIIANYLARTGTTGLSSSYSRYLKLPMGVLLVLASCAIVWLLVVKLGSFNKITGKHPGQKPGDRRSGLGQLQVPYSRTDY